MAVLMPLWHYSLFLILWLPSGQGKIVAISNLATMGYKIYLIRKPNQRPQLVIISDICHKVVVTISDKDCMAMAVTSVKSCWIVMKRDIMAAGRAPTLARRSQERIHNHATYNQIHVSNQGAMALKNQRASERQAGSAQKTAAFMSWQNWKVGGHEIYHLSGFIRGKGKRSRGPPFIWKSIEFWIIWLICRNK